MTPSAADVVDLARRALEACRAVPQTRATRAVRDALFAALDGGDHAKVVVASLTADCLSDFVGFCASRYPEYDAYDARGLSSALRPLSDALSALHARSSQCLPSAAIDAVVVGRSENRVVAVCGEQVMFLGYGGAYLPRRGFMDVGGSGRVVEARCPSVLLEFEGRRFLLDLTSARFRRVEWDASTMLPLSEHYAFARASTPCGARH